MNAELDPERQKAFRTQLRALFPDGAAALAPVKKKRRAPSLEALLADVYATPDEDAPRLVYADALLEAGDVRGELIVLQCARRRDDAPTERETTLLRLNGRAWLGPLAAVLVEWHYERGFLHRATWGATRRRSAPDELMTSPLWSTLDRLMIERGAELPRGPSMRLLPGWKNLRTLRGVHRDDYVHHAPGTLLSLGIHELTLDEELGATIAAEKNLREISVLSTELDGQAAFRILHHAPRVEWYQLYERGEMVEAYERVQDIWESRI